MATSSEDFIVSDALDDKEPKVPEDLNCTLCRKTFRSPRRMPCSHSFCQDCLRSYISYQASVKGSVKEMCCPICGSVVHSGDEVSLDNWVYLFPHDILLLSLLMKSKVNVDLVCDVCEVQDIQTPAQELCIVCEQAFCVNCSKIHRTMRLTNTHNILKIDELLSKEDMILQHSSLFKCMDHVNNHLDLYCKTHEIQLCTKCFFSQHKSCTDVVELSVEASNVSDVLNNIKVQMKEIEDQIKRVTDTNTLNLGKLGSQINYMTEEIRTLKRSVNNALDDFERRVKTECEKIYNDERNKLEQLNLDCKSQILSVRNSMFIIDSVSRFATQTQMFLLGKSLLRQLFSSQTQIEEKYTENRILKFELDINSQLKTVASILLGEIGKMKMTRYEDKRIIPAGFKTPKECRTEILDVKEIKVPGGLRPWYINLMRGLPIPLYTDIKYVSHDSVVMVDFNNNICHLLDSLFNSVCFFKLSGVPVRVCVVGHREIAVSHTDQTIQFLSVKDNTITPTRKITTRHKCYGIAALSQEEMIVSGPCGNDKYYWTVITLDGSEKSYCEFDGEGSGGTYHALNKFKTFLYISVCDDNSLHCFGLDGKKYFTFKHQDLKGPRAVAIDLDHNVILVGSKSNNVFQLSADGVLIQIIANAIPKNPRAMCLNKDGDRFLLTCYEREDLYIFRFVKTTD